MTRRTMMLRPMTTTHPVHDNDAAAQHAHFDWAAQLTRLELGEELHLDFFKAAAAWLRELRGPARTERILDVGSGAGVVTTVLADAFPDTELVAVDVDAVLLDAVMSRAERAGLAQRVQALRAALPDDAARLPEADLIWSSDALHHVGDQQAAVDLLFQRIRPGGLLAICEGGLPARFIPSAIGFGRPGLQTRIDAASAEGFTAMRAALPNSTSAVDDWPGLLRASGAEAISSRSFLVDLPAPLPARARTALSTNLAAQRDWLVDRLDADDLNTITRLLDADDPAGLMHRPDVFFLAARTVHTARRSG